MTEAYKLGTLVGSDFVPHRFFNTWDVETTTGPDRIVVGPTSRHVELMIHLAKGLPEPFGILYVLLVSRKGHEPARYQCPYPCPRNEMEGFLESFKVFFECDGRHHIWVTSLPESSTLVYDQHNIIYAYGPLNQFEEVLKKEGLERGAVSLPVPHSHNYNQQFDQEEQRLFDYWNWLKSPLMETDDL